MLSEFNSNGFVLKSLTRRFAVSSTKTAEFRFSEDNLLSDHILKASLDDLFLL